ncbi:MAG: hypothetical protein GX556_00080 [Fibrobacter sp.]|nr:hypothetical protein [Fibrobacter sp.]
MLRAARFDSHLYEEVEADSTALVPAMTVVVISSIAAGIGTITERGPSGIVIGTFTALASWFIWSLLTYFIGTKLLPEPQTRADPGQLLRTIGFSSSPGVIRILGVIPALGIVAFAVSAVWSLIAMVVAVRQALDYTSTVRAVMVCILGWIFQIIALALLYIVFP